MAIQREWVTPIAVGAFLISAVTGVAIFFHIDTGLAKVAHEWLSWLLLFAVLLHVGANFFGFKRYFSSGKALALMGVAMLVLVASFMPLGGERGGEGGKPFMKPVRALAAAPLSTLAAVAKISPEQLRERLAKANVPAPTSDAQSLADLVGPDGRKQMHIMADLFTDGK